MHLVATILIVCTASAYVTAEYNYSELLTVSLRETNGKNIQGEYIIVFREDVTDQIGKSYNILLFQHYHCFLFF